MTTLERGDRGQPMNHDLPSELPAAPGDDQRTLVERDAAPADADDGSQRPATNETYSSVFEIATATQAQLGEYALIREVGRGGMGVVFQARHVRLNRTVALKMILGGALAHADDLHRFETEVAAAAQLQHPGIVALYDVGTFDKQPYFSMEFISGRSLAQELASGPLSSVAAARYLEATARAVHYAHGRGIIHRDLKPANILLDTDDKPKITDFGLAKVLTTDSGQTRTGTVLGTPSYIAPEQAAGRKDIGPACDIYSLGAILYELLTGKPPFRGETALATLNLVASQDPIAPRLLNPLVDRDLETICLKCLEKHPRARYESAEELADDLHCYLDGVPISARRLHAVGRAIKWVKRKPAAAALLAVTVLALLGFGFFGWNTAHTERQLRQLAEVRGEGMRRLLYLAQIRQAQQALTAGDAARAELILDRWEPLSGGEGQGVRGDLRHWEWYFLKARCQGRFALPGHSERVNSIAFRPDGKQLASAGGPLTKPGEIKIWNAHSGELLRTLKGHGNIITAIVYSPDGKLIFSASYDRSVRVWDAGSGAEVQTLMGHKGQIASLACDPHGKLLASGDADGSIHLWERSPSLPESEGQEARDVWKPRAVLTGHFGEVSSLVFSPTKDRFVSGSRDGSLRTWKTQTGETEFRLDGHQGGVSGLAFNKDGTMLASAGGIGHNRGEVKYWNPATGKMTAVYHGLSDRILGVAFSRDDKLAAGGSDGMIRLWDQRLSNEAIHFRGDTQCIYTLAFSPDGRHLAFAGHDGRIRLWSSNGGQELLVINGAVQVEVVALGEGSGQLLACAGQNGAVGEVHVWDLDANEIKHTFRDHKHNIHALCFSPPGGEGQGVRGGRWLASGGEDMVIRVYDLSHPASAPLTLSGHSGRVLGLAFHPEKHILASASDDDTIRLWDIKPPHPFPSPPGGEGQEVRGGRLLHVLKGHENSVLSVAFSPNGQYLASGSFDKTVRIWEWELGTSFALTGHSGSTNMVAFSPDGRQVASASTDKSIRIWSLSFPSGEGAQVMKLEGSPGPVYALAWHNSGHRIASAGQDTSVRLWDLVTSQEILDLPSPGSPIRSVVFSRDGHILATAGPNQGVRVWDAPEGSLRPLTAPPLPRGE